MNVRKLLLDVIAKATGSRTEISEETNLIQFGLSSLQVMKIAGLLRKSGIKVSFADLMEYKTFGEWFFFAESKLGGTVKKDPQPQVQASDQAFPLTDVQYSYWVGRGTDQPMGGVDCHAYYEFEGKNVNAAKLKAAWDTVLAAHPMLHTRFTADGKQQTMPAVYPNTFSMLDLSAFAEDMQEEKLLEVRHALSHRRFDLEFGETAGIKHCICSGGRSVTCIDFALIVCDVQSIKIVLRDLAACYAAGKTPEVDHNWNFGAYMEMLQKERAEEKAQAAEYWKTRLRTLPLRPDLPLQEKPENILSPRYTHHTDTLSEEQWTMLKKRAAAADVTPAMVLLTAYSQTIHRWSANDRFLINVPLFDRCDDFGNVSNVVADFTTLLLSEQDYSASRTFRENVQKVSADFVRDMHYAAYNGVQIQRDLQRLYSGQRDFAPVVFACNIGMDLISADFTENIGDIRYMVSQTPQVWIDCQVFEHGGKLSLVWDTADALFPKQMTDAMFTAFMQYLRVLSAEETDWGGFCSPAVPLDSIRKTTEELEQEPVHRTLLTEGLIAHAEKTPEKTALYLCETGETVTYARLYETSRNIAAALQEAGVQKGDLVAVILERGIPQITAIYGILLAGGCYVPVSYHQPDMRLKKIFDTLQIGFAVTDDSHQKNWEHVHCLTYENAKNSSAGYLPPELSADDSAYIIMTSGSTGTPKGVEIQHGSAMNTIWDINHRISASAESGILGVSATDFDLSVYDIFGMSSVGGTLYVLTQQNAKDADTWLNLITEHHISLWNSVPVLFDMLLTAAEKRGVVPPLQTVMLSGDWIGILLVKRFHSMLPECTMLAMGGATEASIWSNVFVVPKEIPEDWKSIPYGKALTAQMYRIVDRQGRDCPDWVAGELLIGGTGVAKGYYGDPELTQKKFTSENGVVWYHTGDNGRFWADGTIEFLGRKDFQVKVSGHRIELGEIESAAEQYAGIHRAAAVVYERENTKQIALFYVTEQNVQVDEKELFSLMEKQLPKYMMPHVGIQLEKLPVTANGKVDRKNLVVPEQAAAEKDEQSETFTETEKQLKQIWEENLHEKVKDRATDYFEVGGNSLKATNMLYEIEEKFSVKFKIGMIFRYSSLCDMAAQIEKMQKEG